MEYKLIYSERRSVGIRVCDDGSVEVRAPRGYTKCEVDKLVFAYSTWIENRKAIVENKRKIYKNADNAELEARTRALVLPLMEKYSHLMDAHPKKVKFTSAKKRFGSCSSSGTVCFSKYLCLYPEAGIEYVVVHELAHLFEMNHSKRFYAIVEKHLPDWKNAKKSLKLS